MKPLFLLTVICVVLFSVLAFRAEPSSDSNYVTTGEETKKQKEFEHSQKKSKVGMTFTAKGGTSLDYFHPQPESGFNERFKLRTDETFKILRMVKAESKLGTALLGLFTLGQGKREKVYVDYYEIRFQSGRSAYIQVDDLQSCVISDEWDKARFKTYYEKDEKEVE